MARPRQPVDLLIHKGKKNLTKAEIEKRRSEELHVPFTDVSPPDYLPEKLRLEFTEIADKLLSLKIMTELDEDTLARYLLSKQQYLQFTSLLNKAAREGRLGEMERLSRLQDKAFKQCRSGAVDLGLTISSRCKLVVPDKEPPKQNKFLQKFGNGTSG